MRWRRSHQPGVHEPGVTLPPSKEYCWMPWYRRKFIRTGEIPKPAAPQMRKPVLTFSRKPREINKLDKIIDLYLKLTKAPLIRKSKLIRRGFNISHFVYIYITSRYHTERNGKIYHWNSKITNFQECFLQLFPTSYLLCKFLFMSLNWCFPFYPRYFSHRYTNEIPLCL